MSKLNEIISRVITDDEFRAEFLQDPMRATESYDLTEEDIAELKSIDLKEITAVHEELEERISKSFVNLPAIGSEETRDHSNNHGSTHSNTHSSGW